LSSSSLLLSGGNWLSDTGRSPAWEGNH
jgi:hypothetical protein